MGKSLNQILHQFSWNGLGLAVLAAPIVVGSVHWPVRLVLAALAGALLLALVLLAFRRGRHFRFDGFAILALLVGAFMAFQLMPLGDSTLASLSPAAYESLLAARELGFDPRPCLSIDPVATVGMLTLLGTLLCFYLVAFNLALADGTGNRLLEIVGIAGAAVAAISVVQALVGTKAVLGLYVPDQGEVRGGLLFSTFVNPNNGAAFLNLATLVLVGQWHKAQFGKTKGIYAVLVLLTGAVSMALLSRAGIVALMMGGLFLGAALRWSGGPRGRSSVTFASVLGVFVTVAAGVVFLFLIDLFLKSAENISFLPFAEEGMKMSVWERAKEVIGSYSRWGAGAGGFEAAFSPFNDNAHRHTIAHAENEFLEAALEYGVPVATSIGVAAIVLFWRRFAALRHDAHYAGAAAGLLAMLVHGLADFWPRIPGAAVPAVVALGAISGNFARERRKLDPWRLRISGMKLLPIAAIFYLVLVMGVDWAQSGQPEAAYRLLEQRTFQKGQQTQLDVEVERRSVALHARDGHLFFLLGYQRERAGNLTGARTFYDRAAALCPNCLPPRAGMARLLVRQGMDREALQVLFELATRTKSGRATVFDTIARVGFAPVLVVEVWSLDPDVLYELARHCYGHGQRKLATRILTEMTRQVGPDLKYLRLLAEIYIAADKNEMADEVATQLMGYYPEAKEGFVIQARLYAREGDLEAALGLYEDALERRSIDGDVELSLEFLGLLAKMRQWDRFQGLAAELRLIIGDDNAARARFHLLMALREEMRGELFAALEELEMAEESAPFNVNIPLRKAQLQARVGRPDKAVSEYRKALKISPHNAQAAEGLRNIERARSRERVF